MTVVLKLGGSLLSLNDLADKVRTVLNQRQGQRCLIVPGGGATTDVVRDWSRVHGLTEETAHWLALSSLDLNCRLLQNLLKLRIVRSRVEAETKWSQETSPLLLAMAEFARAEECLGGFAVPHHWSVTSDSMAAWVALRWPADELILLKSVPTPTGLSVSEASHQQMVDSYFPILANQLPGISWCNIRATKIEIEKWH